MNVPRNDPCPCGSGKKYKHCHGKPAHTPLPPEEAAWRKLRSAMDGFPTTMLRFVREVYGHEVLDEAWAEFTLWEDEEAVFDPDSPNLQVFMPWFFHQWMPDPANTLVADVSLQGHSPTGLLLARRGRRLDPVLRPYLEACVATPFSFHEIVHVDPGHGFRARDVLTGEECDVLERSASGTMQRGDIFFGQLVTSHGITLMEACSPLAIPPRERLALVDLREGIAGKGSSLTRDELREWDFELREKYLDCMDALVRPPTPRLQNTDGEPIVFHRIAFQVPSAQAAFDALKHLALDEPEGELLQSAEFDDAGHLRHVDFPWTAAGNPIHKSWSNTVLGHIEISGDTLVASVNSAGRAARLRGMVESLCPEARHLKTDVETLDEARAAKGTGGRGPDDADEALPAASPEVRERIREMMAEHYEHWLHEGIPALGGLSPTAAMGERSGREKVEALIAQIERDGERMDPPIDEAITKRLRERLGLTE